MLAIIVIGFLMLAILNEAITLIIALPVIENGMRRYALEHDGVRRYLASDEKTNAAQRALSILGTAPSTPRRCANSRAYQLIKEIGIGMDGCRCAGCTMSVRRSISICR